MPPARCRPHVTHSSHCCRRLPPHHSTRCLPDRSGQSCRRWSHTQSGRAAGICPGCRCCRKGSSCQRKMWRQHRSTRRHPHTLVGGCTQHCRRLYCLQHCGQCTAGRQCRGITPHMAHMVLLVDGKHTWAYIRSDHGTAMNAACYPDSWPLQFITGAAATTVALGLRAELLYCSDDH